MPDLSTLEETEVSQSQEEKKMKKALAVIGCTAALLVGGVACSSDADVASENLSKSAEQFEVNRRITVVNGITDKYVMVVEGKCSLEFPDGRTEIICKLDNGSFVKHYVLKSDNTFIMSEQTNGTAVSTDRYRVIFKPESILPNIDCVGDPCE